MSRLHRPQPNLRVAAFLALAAAAHAIGGPPWFLSIVDPRHPSDDTYGVGVSGDGTCVVGAVANVEGAVPFRWSLAGGFQRLEVPPGGTPTAIAFACSFDGSTAVGLVDVPPSWGRHAAKWDAAGELRLLPHLDVTGQAVSYANACSADGLRIVGASFSAASQASVPVRWDEGGTTISALGSSVGEAYAVTPSGVQIVGGSLFATGLGAFRWNAALGMGALGEMVGGGHTHAAYGLSADGQVVVGEGVAGNQLVAFRWSDATGAVPLGVLANEPGSAATALSADGTVIVGASGFRSLPGKAFIWTQDRGLRDLKEVLEADFGLNIAGHRLDYASGISADGLTIAGMGQDSSGHTRGWVAHLGTTCIANCDGSTSSPVLNISDFICFLTRYAAGDPYANCDGSTSPPILNVNDFVCFQAKFAAGCP